VTEFGGIGGGQAPHEEASTREHFEEVGEDVRRAREADRAAKTNPKRPWWRFWAKRST
jgi:hypothetical protein